MLKIPCFCPPKKGVVLIITRMHHGKLLGDISAFSRRFYDTYVVVSPTVCSKWNIWIRIKMRLGFDISKYIIKKDKHFCSKIEELCNNIKPDIILVFQGTQLLPDTIEKLKQHSYMALRFIDRISLFPKSGEYAKYYDYVSTFVKEDAELLETKGIQCFYQPATMINTEYFHKDIKKDIDVSFVGVMYDDRREYLTKLVKDLPELNIKIWGEYAPLRRPGYFFKWLFDKRLRECFVNKEVCAKEVNDIYNRSKICLNMNRSNAGNSWAGRFADITATKSFQLVTYNKMLENEFGESIETFKDYSEMKRKIVTCLKEQETNAKRAENCYKILSDMDRNTKDLYTDIIERAENR